jgi:hypothetical protein
MISQRNFMGISVAEGREASFVKHILSHSPREGDGLAAAASRIVGQVSQPVVSSQLSVVSGQLEQTPKGSRVERCKRAASFAASAISCPPSQGGAGGVAPQSTCSLAQQVSLPLGCIQIIAGGPIAGSPPTPNLRIHPCLVPSPENAGVRACHFRSSILDLRRLCSRSVGALLLTSRSAENLKFREIRSSCSIHASCSPHSAFPDDLAPRGINSLRTGARRRARRIIPQSAFVPTCSLAQHLAAPPWKTPGGAGLPTCSSAAQVEGVKESKRSKRHAPRNASQTPTGISLN